MNSSLFLRIAGKTLSALHKILPEPLYSRLYNFSFPRYKGWQRRRYRKHALRRPGADVDMIEMVYKCLKYSLVGWQGMEATYRCTREVLARKVEGDFVECGVAQGGSALLMALMIRKYAGESRRLWLFDSYEGLPDPTEKDFKEGRTGSHVRPLPKGSCLGTIEDVRRLLFEEHELSESNIHLVKGWFQDTLPLRKQDLGRIAVLRLDGDWYESTKVCLEQLFDRVSKGGYVILDDYFSCFGCKRASDEILTAKGLSNDIVSDGRGGAFFKKR